MWTTFYIIRVYLTPCLFVSPYKLRYVLAPLLSDPRPGTCDGFQEGMVRFSHKVIVEIHCVLTKTLMPYLVIRETKVTGETMAKMEVVRCVLGSKVNVGLGAGEANLAKLPMMVLKDLLELQASL